MNENPDLEKVYYAFANIKDFSKQEKELLIFCLVNSELSLESLLEINKKISEKIDVGLKPLFLEVEISVGIYTNKRYCKTIEAVHEFIDSDTFVDFPSDVVMAMKPGLLYFADSNQEEVTIHVFLKGLSFSIPINIKKIEG